MEIVENKALLFETPHADIITDSIEKSAVVATNGSKTKMLMRWGLKEAQTLATLHTDVPSPILRDYKWTGKLVPFEHQKTTPTPMKSSPGA